MGLKYWDIPWQRYREVTHYNAFRGYSAALCGTGPSIRKVKQSALDSKENLLKVCLNNAFKFVEPDIWMAVDSPDSFGSQIWTKNCIKYYNNAHRDKMIDGVKARDFPNTYLYETFLVDKHSEEFTQTAPYMKFLFEGHTFSLAVGILNWLGVDTIYLMGCDLGGSNSISKEEKGSTYNLSNQKNNLKNTLDFLRFLSDGSRMSFISATPHSPLNEFLPYVSPERIGNEN